MGDPRPRLTVAGYLSLDTIVCPYGTFENVPGGAALYAALGARAAGAQVRLRALLCADFPPLWLDTLASAGIDLEGLEPAAGTTRRARLEDREASHARATRRASPHHRDPAWWARTRALAPMPCRSPADVVVVTAMPVECLVRHVETARALGARVVADTSEAYAAAEGEALLAALPTLDLFAPSREEVHLLSPELDDMAAQRALDSHCPQVVQKRGPDGMWWSSAGLPVYHEPSHVREIADSTGAGDAAVGALAAGLARGVPVAELLREASAIAACAAGMVGPLGLEIDLERGMGSEPEPHAKNTDSRHEGVRMTWKRGKFGDFSAVGRRGPEPQPREGNR